MGPDRRQIVGNRIVSGDLDGDGYPDLIIHAIGSNNRETVGTPPAPRVRAHERARARRRPAVRRPHGRERVRHPARRLHHRVPLGAARGRSATSTGTATSTSSAAPTPIPTTVASPPTAADMDRSQILLNDGKGHFTLKPGSGVAPSEPRPTTGATFVDVDRDGKLDLFLGFFYDTATASRARSSSSAATATAPSRRLHRRSHVNALANYRPAYGVTTCDVDGDGVPELLVSALRARAQHPLQERREGPLHRHRRRLDATPYDDDIALPGQPVLPLLLHACTRRPPTAQGAAAPADPVPHARRRLLEPGHRHDARRASAATPSPPSAPTSPATGCSTSTTRRSRTGGRARARDASRLLVNVGAPRQAPLRPARPHQARHGRPHPTRRLERGRAHGGRGRPRQRRPRGPRRRLSDYPDQFGLLFHQKPDGTFEEIGAGLRASTTPASRA